MKTTIPIVLSANNYFVPYMAVTMQSVMENASLDRDYVFFILHREIDSNSMDLLRKQIAAFRQFSIEFIDVTRYLDKYNLFVSGYITVESYFRLLIPELLSAYQKAIYLDGDMICLADISELYNIDMKTNIIAAVRDQGVINYYYKKKRKSSHDENDEDYIDGITLLKQSHNYFNGGMQIFHIDEFKKKYKIDDCIKFSASKKWKWHDQDVLNILCEDAVYFLSPAWNFMHSESIFESAPEFVRNEYHHAKHSPKIIHFSFDKKPWKNVYAIPYFEMFWKYATRIPFIDVIIERMWKEGLIGYKTYQKNQEYVLKDIEGGHGGMRFIIKCIKAWLKRGK